MNKDELLLKINAKVEEVRNLVAQNKTEEAKVSKNELINLQEQFDLIKDLEDEEYTSAANTAKPIAGTKTSAQAFINVLKAGLRRMAPAQEDLEMLNVMKEGSDPDGGLTVPSDISTTINELRRSEDALEMIVTVERVSTDKGSRVHEVHADQVPFDNVEEEAEFPDISTPTFKNITYAIKKKGGILKVTRELLQDSAENILAYLRKWIAKKEKATRNAMILKMINTITNGKEVAVSNVDDIKDVFNTVLDPAIAANSIILTNQDGFNWLDKLKDIDGKYVVQPDITKATAGNLFGKYQIKVVSNTTMPTLVGKTPLVIGDFKEAITIYDRETLSIEFSSEAGDLWAKDMTGMKVRERLDIQAVDDEAIVKAIIACKYTQKQLEKMTVEQIKELAQSLGYTITKTVKAEVITEFLTQQV